MDLATELFSALQAGGYIILGFAAVLLVFIFVYYSGVMLGVPVGRKLMGLQNKGLACKYLTPKQEQTAKTIGLMLAGIVFSILVGVQAPQIGGDGKPVMESLALALFRIFAGDLMVMGFFRVVVGLLL